MIRNGIVEAAERITSEANLWADLGSRSAAKEVLSQAERLGLRWRLVEPPPEWRHREWAPRDDGD